MRENPLGRFVCPKCHRVRYRRVIDTKQLQEDNLALVQAFVNIENIASNEPMKHMAVARILGELEEVQAIVKRTLGV